MDSKDKDDGSKNRFPDEPDEEFVDLECELNPQDRTENTDANKLRAHADERLDEEGPFLSLDNEINQNWSIYCKTPPTTRREERRLKNINKHDSKSPKVLVASSKRNNNSQKSHAHFWTEHDSSIQPVVLQNSQETGDEAKEALKLKKRKRDGKKQRSNQREEKIFMMHTAECIVTSSPDLALSKHTSYSSNRYQSLKYMQVSPPISPIYATKKRSSNPYVECSRDRIDFHKTLSLLIKLGSSNTKKEQSSGVSNSVVQRQNSQPQELWQTQYSDLLWFDLQAWHNCVAMDLQDTLLMYARTKALDVAKAILEFRFETTINCISRSVSLPLQHAKTKLSFDGELGSASNDPSSTVGESKPSISHSLSDSAIEYHRKEKSSSDGLFDPLRSSSLAFGSVITAHMKIVDEAYAQITDLCYQLETIEHLYHTRKALEHDIPMYKSKTFTNRVKTLNLWLNITTDIIHKLKLLGRHLGVYESTDWPGMSYDARYSINVGVGGVNSSSSVTLGKPHGKISNRRSLTHLTSVQEDFSDLNQFAAEDMPCSTTPVMTRKHSRSPPLTRIFSECHFSFDECSSTSIYRPYVDSGLKHTGLQKMMIRLQSIQGPTLIRAKMAMERPNDVNNGNSTPDFTKGDDFLSHHLCLDTCSVSLTDPHTHCFTSHGIESNEFKDMNLPSFRPAYLFLLRVLLDVMHESLRFRLAQKTVVEPSCHSINQLIHECKEVIRWAVWIKDYYHRMVRAVCHLRDTMPDNQETDIEEYEVSLQDMLQVYFDYLHSWMSMLQRLPKASASLKNILEEEWAFSKDFCPHIRGGESQAGKRFCIMASNLLESTSHYIEAGTDDICSGVQDSMLCPENIKQSTQESSRGFKQLLFETRERALRALSFAKMLRKDLEIAAEFHLSVSTESLLESLKKSKHVMVRPDNPGHMLFVPDHVKGNTCQILQLLSDLCGRDDFIQSSPTSEEGYLLLVKTESTDKWNGECVDVSLTIETTIALSDIEVENLLLVVNHSSQLSSQRKAFEKAVGNTVALVIETTSSHNTIADALSELKSFALKLGEMMTACIYRVLENLDIDSKPEIEEFEKIKLSKYYRETMHNCFMVGFEYHNEVARLLSGELRQQLGKSSLMFAKKWMEFVVTRCAKGNGRKPRWAQHGLDFLIIACDPQNIAQLEDDDFQDLKALMNRCIHHVIGSPSTSCSVSPAPKHRSASPTRESFNLSKRSHSLNSSTSGGSCSSPNSPVAFELRRSSDVFRPVISPPEDRLEPNFRTVAKRPSPIPIIEKRITHICKSLEMLEEARMRKLQDERVIGRVSNQSNNNNPVVNCRKVKFRWQRGVIIGQGQRGTTVYSCINMDTGETLAVKEIKLQMQRNNQNAVKDLAEEIKNLEGISHPNLVKYYGVEIHREELLIFMEYCDDGTLGQAAQERLPEDMIRHYTKELITAIAELHEHGIIHRDIKGANIFLSSDGHLKLGDFGCAIKLRCRQTLPGEISDYLGTPAYMSPEVVNANDSQGYGRASDIWSLGCVVIEMLTGKLPWHECHHVVIVYKVGMGAIPKFPETASDEAKDFLSHCLKHKPEDRWTANQLLDHAFIKVETLSSEES